MFNFATVPFRGREGYGQPLHGSFELHETTAAADMYSARAGINRRYTNPPILDQLRQNRAGVHHFDEAFRRGLDNEKNAHRLVDLNHLPWQPYTEVAGMAVHHSHQPSHNVRELCSTAVAVVIHE